MCQSDRASATRLRPNRGSKPTTGSDQSGVAAGVLQPRSDITRVDTLCVCTCARLHLPIAPLCAVSTRTARRAQIGNIVNWFLDTVLRRLDCPCHRAWGPTYSEQHTAQHSTAHSIVVAQKCSWGPSQCHWQVRSSSSSSHGGRRTVRETSGSGDRARTSVAK